MDVPSSQEAEDEHESADVSRASLAKNVNSSGRATARPSIVTGIC